MIFINEFTDYKEEAKTAVTIGKFDALHLGHRLLVDTIVKRKSLGEKSVVICFSTSPRIALGADYEAKFIITKGERSNILSSLGVDYLFELHFDESMIKMEPEDFLRHLKENLNMNYLCVGTDFRFGHKGRGDVNLLTKLSGEYDFTLDARKKVTYGGDVVSSTRIRDEIQTGDIKVVNEMLGYPYSFEGEVISGNSIGHGLGFPTANIVPSPVKVLPAFGVYKAMITIDNESFLAITNLGIRPTIDEKEKRTVIETFILDYNHDIYGKRVRVSLLDFIRPEKKFSSKEELIFQIKKDIEAIKK